MNALLEWVGLLALCMLGAAVLVAGWEHLAREAAAADRSGHPGARPPVHPGLHSGAVDVPIDPAADAASDTNPNHAAMAAVLTRAAARPARDGSPWLDTCPQVTLGWVEPGGLRAAEPPVAPHPPAAPMPVRAAAAQPSPAPAPAAAPEQAQEQGERPSTIERAALR